MVILFCNEGVFSSVAYYSTNIEIHLVTSSSTVLVAFSSSVSVRTIRKSCMYVNTVSRDLQGIQHLELNKNNNVDGLLTKREGKIA